MTQCIEILKTARKLISDPKNWTQHVFARDVAGQATNPENIDACYWCALGAVRNASAYCLGRGCDVAVYHDNLSAQRALKNVLLEGGHVADNVPDFNDHYRTTHSDVLKLFDTAIERETYSENAEIPS